MIVPAPVNEPGCFSELPGSACSFGVCALGDLRLWETHRDNWLLSQGDKWLGIWRFVQGIPLQAISGLHLILQILQSSSSAHPFKLEETTNTTHDNTRLTKQPNSGNNFRFRCKKKKNDCAITLQSKTHPAESYLHMWEGSFELSPGPMDSHRFTAARFTGRQIAVCSVSAEKHENLAVLS